MKELTFFGWDRAAGALAANPHGGRLQAIVNLRVRGNDPAAAQVRPLSFEFLGPPDVTALLPGAIGHVSPEPGSTDAEETMCAYVELGAPDLPWRYSPEARVADAWKPWLVLVVGPTDQVALQPGRRVAIAPAVQAAHPLGQSARWAHVQRTNPSPPAAPHRLSRLLSPYPLRANTDYLAVVVPAHKPNGEPSWTGAGADALVPVYHSWRFRTGDAGDFKDLALRLKARRIDDPMLANLGRDAVEYPLPDRANVVTVRSALVPPAAVPPTGADPDGPPPSDVAASVAAMRVPTHDALGRHVIQLPLYGEAWVADPLQPPGGWGAALNGHPRHRVAAGLGLWCGVGEQDLISEAAAARAAGVFVASQRIRGLTAGLAASGALWARRLPATPEARLLLFGPALARVAGDYGDGRVGSVLGAIADPGNGATNGRPLPPALLSSAARRLLRPRTSLARLAGENALAPESIVGSANRCERLAPVERPARAPDRGASQRFLPHADFLAEELGLGETGGLFAEPTAQAVGQALDAAGFDRGWLDAISPGLWPEMLRALTAPDGPDEVALAQLRERSRGREEALGAGRLGETLDRIEQDAPRPPRCRPVGLAVLDAALTAAFRPDRQGLAARRVLDTIEGLDPLEPFAPPEICPDLDLPAWTFLRREDRRWLLLGREGIAPDDVVAVGTNPRFINAFLAGLNTQALAELRWRNIPVKSGCTPLRRFWNRIDREPGGGGPAPTDINGIASWDVSQPLGHPAHSPDPDGVRHLVLVFRTDLFRRYPRTLVYLTPSATTAAGTPDWAKDAPLATKVAPIFSGEVDPDLVFFGFPLPPEDLEDRWVVVEEPPPGYRFSEARLRLSGALDGGAAAAAAFAPPTRVLFRGDQFLAVPA